MPALVLKQNLLFLRKLGKSILEIVRLNYFAKSAQRSEEYTQTLQKRVAHKLFKKANNKPC
jgi:hypothetical protein